MKLGRVTLGVPNSYSQVTMSQGADQIHGTIRVSSNRQYAVVFSDGYLQDQKSGRSWTPGCVFLVEKDKLLWIKKIERPMNAAVSDNGVVAVLYTTHKETPSNSKPREFIDLGGSLTLMDTSGEELVSMAFGSNLLACAISNSGKYAAVATLAPDDSIYFFSILDKKLLWKYKNHAKKRVLGLLFMESQLDVRAGGSLDSKEKEYALSLDGKLTPEYQTKFDESMKIKKQPPAQKAESLKARLLSDDKHDVMNALEELKSFTNTKGAIPYYEIILEGLAIHFSDRKEVFDATWKVFRIILKKKAKIASPYVPKLLNQIRKGAASGVEATLLILGEIGRANPSWVMEDRAFILEKLKSSAWNERRFAAFAIGSIGAAEPAYAKEAIPIMLDYVSHPKRVKNELEFIGKKDSQTAISLGVAASMGVEPDVWLRDACIDALGMIGEKSSEAVVDAVSILQELAVSGDSPFTQKKALRAMELISGKK
jgi:hypothetical protein